MGHEDEWGYSEDARWEKGWVACPKKDSELFTFRKINKGTPENCPFKFEHLILKGKVK